MTNNIYVIKLGSNVILDENGVNESVMTNLAREVDLLQKAGRKVLIVSSGAIGLGKKNLGQNIIKGLTTIEAGQVFSSIGQATLMDVYISYFGKYNIKVSQALLTRRDFQDRERYNSMKKVMLSSLELQIIPIINENDVLSQEELDFSDNDELSALIAAMIGANNLIILSNIDGLYDKYPGGNIIKEVNTIDQNILRMVGKDKSTMGKGGMESKLKIAKMMMDLGIKMYLANGKQEDIITKIIKGENPGTLFESHSEKKVDSLRKWLKAGAVPTGKMKLVQ
ncbi:MAG: glutamate 5-kinase [Candidatus Gracilibacteria bacterium]